MTRSRRIKGAVALLAAVFVGAQFLPVSRTNPDVVSELTAPPEVQDLLVRACFDCHSPQTVWPWYSRVAPVSWWVASHIRKGRADLNFSEWPVFVAEERDLYLQDIEKQLLKGEMPPGYYKIAHPEARLTDDEIAVLLAWARDH